MKAALLQLSSSDDPSHNIVTVRDMVRSAAAQGAQFVLTPEVTNCVSTSRTRQMDVLEKPDDDAFLKTMQEEARDLSIWLMLGSLAVKTDDPDGRFANRCYLIAPNGSIRAEYDKIHMFDVDIDANETYRESSGYRPGTRAVVAETDFGSIGMSICYDMRFPLLYQSLARAGAEIMTVPAAFSPVTGAAHWHSLLRARAIETGCIVIAPAQTGAHDMQAGKPRSTYGHSLVVSPWGDVLLDAGTEPGAYLFDLDVQTVEDARRRVPALMNARKFENPE
ncbi:MAG: carbon-nitrogen hydrolase family protein [Aliishimia sp.]